MVTEIEVGGSDTASPLNLAKRVKLVASHVDLPRSSILDAGCGAGDFVEALAASGAEVHGVEYVEAKVKQWSVKHPGDDRVRAGDLQRLEFGDSMFDAVLLNEVLEHVPDDRTALAEIHRVLKPGGKLMMFSPNRFHPFETHGVYSRRTGAHFGMARTFMLPWVPVAFGRRFVKYWARNYWPSELAALTKEAGFRIKYQSYVWQTFENNSGQQSNIVRKMAPFLRVVSKFAEHVPIIRKFGVSQLIVAECYKGLDG